MSWHSWYSKPVRQKKWALAWSLTHGCLQMWTINFSCAEILNLKYSSHARHYHPSFKYLVCWSAYLFYLFILWKCGKAAEQLHINHSYCTFPQEVSVAQSKLCLWLISQTWFKWQTKGMFPIQWYNSQLNHSFIASFYTTVANKLERLHSETSVTFLWSYGFVKCHIVDICR